MFYVAAQCAGAIAGVVLAHAMFDLPLWMLSNHARSGAAQGLSEAVATFGVLATILSVNTVPTLGGSILRWAPTSRLPTGSPRLPHSRIPRSPLPSLTDTFAGIRALDVPLFIGAQCVGAAAATGLFRWLSPLNGEQLNGNRNHQRHPQ